MLRRTELVIPAAAGVLTAYAIYVIAPHTVGAVASRGLLPRWDLAAHLGHGWLDYHLLATGQIGRLLLDLWMQGYWPPLLSLWQIPFYLVLGGTLTAGLWSSAAAFVLAAVAGAAILSQLWGRAGLLPAAVFLALLASSPFLLAYGAVTMSETFGAFVQLLVLLGYVRYCQQASPSAARLFAISLTLLFFTKYNYFLMLAVPLALHEWLERTRKQGVRARLAALTHVVRAAASPAAVLVGLYLASLAVVVATGGFEFRVLGQRVSVRSIGSSGHVVLYLLLARLAYLHRRGRIDWGRLTSFDQRIRPLLIWFAVPVTIWLASPYPNHLRDVFSLIVNRPHGEPALGAGLAGYVEALRTVYFYSDWTLAFVLSAFALAAARYRAQPPVIRWLLLAVPLQLAAIALHQTRFPRFLLLTVVLSCLVASSECARWSAGRRRAPAAFLLATAIAAIGLVATGRIVAEDRFRRVAMENYVDSPALRSALAAIRQELTPRDRLAVVGQSNEVSPALIRWHLGPPSGVPCFPFRTVGERGIELAQATKVLLIEPDAGFPHEEIPGYYHAERQAIVEAAGRRDLVLRRELPIDDLHMTLRLYHGTRAPVRVVDCRPS